MYLMSPFCSLSTLNTLFFCLSRMIDWLSWPLAHHVDTWVIALLKGLAAVQKFTILIDVTLLKIELVRQVLVLMYCCPQKGENVEIVSIV